MVDELEFTARTTGEGTETTAAFVEQIKAEAHVPRSIKRIAARSTDWGIPRSFVGYRIDPTHQTVGTAKKYVLISEDGGPDYIVKYAQKFNFTETLTELFINRFGAACSFDMAHSGLGSIDGEAVFVTRSFLTRDEHLVHGSFLIEEHHKALGVLETLKRSQEQEFYSIDFVLQTISDYCGTDGSCVIDRFIQMLLFDALVGSNDRHSQNWGVIRASKTQTGYRFSPIFDTARALLWNTSDVKLASFQKDNNLLRNHMARARPIIGPERKFLESRPAPCNHFHFVQNLITVAPHLDVDAVTKVLSQTGRIARQVMRNFPFQGGFNKLRRDMIVKLLSLRADELISIMQKGGPC
jgi:HipA-like protein